MGLFKKIFGTEKLEPAKTAAADAPPSRRPRVVVTPLHRISFTPESRSHLLGLGNISVGGMGVIYPKGENWHVEGGVTGIIKIDQEEFAIQARIRHLGSALAGCEFLGDNVSFKRSIESYLRVEILALNLRKVDESYLKQDPRGKTIWYTDGSRNEIFCVVDSTGIVSFHMGFLGNYVEGSRGNPPRAGQLIDQNDDDDGVAGHKAATLLDFSSSPAKDITGLAAVFVRNIERMPSELRDQLIKELVP